MGLAACHPSGALNILVATRFLENMCTSWLKSIVMIEDYLYFSFIYTVFYTNADNLQYTVTCNG